MSTGNGRQAFRDRKALHPRKPAGSRMPDGVNRRPGAGVTRRRATREDSTTRVPAAKDGSRMADGEADGLVESG